MTGKVEKMEGPLLLHKLEAILHVCWDVVVGILGNKNIYIYIWSGQGGGGL